MGGLIFILPILAFDVWLLCTTGRRQWRAAQAAKKWPQAAGVILAGIVLGIFLGFIIKYKIRGKEQMTGFPVPFSMSFLENDHWVSSTPAQPLPIFAQLTDFMTGLVAPLIPFKIAEFLKQVKQELA